MTDVTNLGTRPRRSRLALLAALAAVLVLADVAAANIAIRRHTPHDQFFFHGNYSTTPFDPASGFGLEIWNCAGGVMPLYLSGRERLVICATDAQGNFTLAELVYAVEVPPGACIDHGSSCYYRDRNRPFVNAGVRYLRIRYARRHRGNRVWLESYGDLSAATHARMLMMITINGQPRAVLEDTFTPLPNGGWFSPF